eukprot:gene6361-7089_t
MSILKSKEETDSSRRNKYDGDYSATSKISKLMEALGQRLKKDGLKLFLLVLTNGLYLYLGGMVFYFLERSSSVNFDHKKQIIRIAEAFKLIELKNRGNTTKSPLSIGHNFTEADFAQMDKFLHNLCEIRKHADGTRWTVMNSVFFASTVVTTIGYGNLAPATGFGRAFCVVYAIFGIPLTLILLAIVGKILAKYINELCGLIVQSLRRYFCADYTYDSTDGETDLNAPVWLAMLFITLFLILDAVVFVFMEDWSFGTSLYFVFITLTTIGFGDFVPTKSEAVWFNVSFLYIGLAAVSITINLFIANISIQFRRHKDKFKIVQHIERELDSEDCETTPLTRDMEKPKEEDAPPQPDPKPAEEPRPKRKTSRVRFQTDNEECK